MTTSSAQTGTAATEREQPTEKLWKRRLRENQSIQFVVLVILFALPAFLYLRNFFMTDPDFGWHLRAGQWILSHHAVPFTDPFSPYWAGKHLYDYNWLLDMFFCCGY